MRIVLYPALILISIAVVVFALSTGCSLISSNSDTGVLVGLGIVGCTFGGGAYIISRIVSKLSKEDK